MNKITKKQSKSTKIFYRLSSSILFLLLMVFISFNLPAHHATSALYDFETIGNIEGEVTFLFWRNPHVRFRVRSTENGQEHIWEVESGSVNSLQRSGIESSVIEVGDRIKVEGRMSRLGRRQMYANALTLPGGEEIRLSGRSRILDSAAANAEESNGQPRGLFRVWQLDGYGDLPDFDLTPAAAAAREAFDPLTDDPALSCIPPGLPSAMRNPYPLEFIDQGTSIALYLEEWDGLRTIYMSSQDDEGESLPAPMGYSVGHWEDTVLVVNTNQISYPYADDLGTPQSTAVTMVEHFTLSENDTRLHWTASVADPETYAGTTFWEMFWKYTPGEQRKSYNCSLPEE